MSKPLATDVHFRVLRLIEGQPDISQREIAQELGVSLGKVNYCLKALIEKGQIKIRNFTTSDNKLKYTYVLTPHGMARKGALVGKFLQIKVEEFEVLKAEIERLQREIGDVKPSTNTLGIQN